MKFIKVSVYRKIMVVFMVAIILLYTFSIILYMRNVNSIKNQLTESVYMMDKNYIKSMERNIMKLKELIVLCTMKQDWSSVSTMRGNINNYDKLQMLLYAERLQAIKNISFDVDDVRANFPSWGRTLSANSGLIDFKVDEFNNIKMPLNSVGAQFVYYDDGIYLTSAYQYKYPNVFSIVLKLDMQELDESLSDINMFNKSYTMLVKSNGGKLLAISNGDKIPNNALEIINRLKSGYGNFALDIDHTKYICVYDSSSYLGFTVVNLIPATELYKSLTIYYVLIWLFSLVIIIIIVFYIHYTYKTIGKPMLVLINAFKQLEKEDVCGRIKIDINSDFAYLYDSFNQLVERKQHLIKEVYEKEILVQDANLKQLQTQINPHFLYNSFYTLHRMIKLGDNENAEIFSCYLGKYFKYITRNALDEVPLSMEVEHAKAYSDIMVLRLGNIVSIVFGKIPEKFAELIVPRLILQPILENAFEHGIRGILKEGLIQVHFIENNNDLLIIVEDNGAGIPYEKLLKLNEQISNTQTNGEVTAIVNIHRRIRLKFGEGYGLLISNNKLEGTSITLSFKILGGIGSDL